MNQPAQIWQQHDPRPAITYWDAGLTTWDDTETTWLVAPVGEAWNVWTQQQHGFETWIQHDPRTSITYWDAGLTTWDETESSWDTNQVILKLWSKQT